MPSFLKARFLPLLFVVSVLLSACLPDPLEEIPDPTPFPVPGQDSYSTDSIFPPVYEIRLGLIRDLAFSPDGSLLAAAADTGLTIYDSSTLEEVWSYPRRVKINCAAWSPDGSRIAIGLENETLEIRTTDTFSLEMEVDFFTHPVSDAAWNYDGSKLGALAHQQIYILDPKTWEEIASVGTIRLKFDWAPGKDELLNHDFSLYTTNPDTLEEIKVFNITTTELYDFQWLEIGEEDYIVVTGSLGENITSYFTGETEYNTLYIESESPFLAVSPDSSMGLTDANQGDLVLQSLPDGSIEHTWAAHDDPVAALAWSPEGSLAASASYDGTLKIWDTNSWEQVAGLEGFFPNMDMLYWFDNKLLSASTNSSGIYIWNLFDGSLEQVIETDLIAVNHFLVSSEWSQILVYGFKSYPSDTSQTLPTFEVYSTEGELLMEHTLPDQVTKKGLQNLCWQDQNTVVIWDEYYFQSWNLETGDFPYRDIYGMVTEEAAAGSFDPSCSWFLPPESDNGYTELQPVSEDEYTRRLPPNFGSEISQAAWSPSGKNLALQTPGQGLFIIDSESWSSFDIFEIFWNPFIQMVWSPDEEKITTMDEYGYVQIWSTSSGEKLYKSYIPDLNPVLAWSEDSERLIISKTDGPILILPLDALSTPLPQEDE